MSSVWLVKSDGSNQPYGSLLKENGFSYENIPTLDFNYINLDMLETAVINPNNYSGMILTSVRAVECIAKLGKNVLELINEKWTSHKIFVVGKATAKAVRESLSLDCVGEESGNAKQLINVILRETDPIGKPLLYLCGNLKRDELPNLLRDNNRSFELLTCYETIPHPDLEKRLKECSKNIPQYIVFFSPSGVEFSRSFIENLIDLNKVRVIAIGPTTNSALCSKNIQVYGVCREPTPEALIEVIKT